MTQLTLVVPDFVIGNILVIQRYFTLLMSCLSILGCTDSGLSPDCAFATDTVSIIDLRRVGNQSYALVHRISGWHDKIESFELYNVEPVFDSCGNSLVALLYRESVDDKDANNNDQYIAHIFIEPPGRIIFDYVQGEIPKPDYYRSLRLELKD
ncbi:hypothetical protein BTA51_22375 [Hahella sp. CCB-MM4]|uniref:hypothetical protein n=1 Tax=Hahella sp. (strain CCB-MM4) TaxID=1926491 RepID=UPI000B9BD9FF|nr:hypothetical protein [Hahella sp. CCB-MM4]OZG71127.1 hypothetical protein BTA51_22375 [Hahella sp. CCB-MM4]